MNEVVHTSPTIGSNVEEIVVKNTHFLMWDIGGQESLRSSWNTYYSNTEVWEATLRSGNSISLFEIVFSLLGILVDFYKDCSHIVPEKNSKKCKVSLVCNQFLGNIWCIFPVYFTVMFDLWHKMWSQTFFLDNETISKYISNQMGLLHVFSSRSKRKLCNVLCRFSQDLQG